MSFTDLADKAIGCSLTYLSDNGRFRVVDSGPDQPAPVYVLELIPGEHYVVFTGTEKDEAPDQDTAEELRILAYARRNKDTLGGMAEQVTATLAEAVAGGILTNSLWAGCGAAGRYARKLRGARHDARATTGAEGITKAAQRAMEAPEAAIMPVAPSAAAIRIVGAAVDGTPWKLAFHSGAEPVNVHVDAGGTVFDVMIGRCALDSMGATSPEAQPDR